MKASEIYRKAAHLMERGDHSGITWDSCCWAIGLIKQPDRKFLNCGRDPECRAMKRVFAPRMPLGYWMHNIGDHDRDRHNGRILALCFMACIAEDEEKK